jgi:glycosyltransferase involved in cell wall biosynthesis
MNLASIVISTRNRKEELARAVSSALRQKGNVEVLVMDDGSTDGTCEMLERRFPRVLRHRTERNLGYIEQRNRGADLARGDIIISLDDDAEFSDDTTVGQAMADFDNPFVGAVAMPYVDVKYGPAVIQRAPSDDTAWVTSEYRGTAHALRRDIFVRLGGYHSYLFRQGEEADYCQRMLDAGYVVRLGRSTPIRHNESPKRDPTLIIQYAARSKILCAWYSVPVTFLPVHLAGTSAVVLCKDCRRGYRWAGIKGLLVGYCALLHELPKRQPVRWGSYRLFRSLRKKGPWRFSAVEALVAGLRASARVALAASPEQAA